MLNQEYEKAPLFYGVQIPAGIALPEGVVVESFYTDKVEALKILKKIKPARMKQFARQEDAVMFNSTQPDNSQGDSAIVNGGGGETLPFPSVKLQSLVILRQAIEQGNIDKIKELIDGNPRYLISSGDTPTILQERYRYNALHSAALKGQVEAGEVILNYLSSPELFSRLYLTDTDKRRETRMSFLIDLYLNTPDKGCNETPLHFAAKFGHVEMVRLLVNEASVDKLRVNRDGLTAAQVTCTRVSNSNKDAILQLLEGQCYIPLYRSEDDTLMPFVGEPWSPGCQSSPRARKSHPNGDENMLSPLRSAHRHVLPPIYSPSSCHGISPGMAVKAVVGPMSPKQASEFKRSWPSPRQQVNIKKRKTDGQEQPQRSHADIIRTDPYKGLELVGRNLASEMEVPWAEFWDFLGCSVDIRQHEGLQKFEDYLESQMTAVADPVNMASGDDQLSHAAQCPPSHLSPSGETVGSPVTQLCRQFCKLVLRSPSPPSSPSPAQSLPDRTAAQSMGCTSPESLRFTAPRQSASISSTRRRTRLELMIPGIIPVVDTLRYLWPFNREVGSGCSPKMPVERKTDTTPSTPAMAKTHKHSKPVFIRGEKPCKIDMDVLNALESVDVDAERYPSIHNWLKNVKSFSHEARNRWQSPGEMRHHERLKPFKEDCFKRRLVLE